MVGNPHDFGLNIDMLRGPIEIGMHDAERVQLMEHMTPMIALIARGIIAHHGDEPTREGGIALLDHLWQAFEAQRWNSAELNTFWQSQNNATYRARALEILRRGDGEAFIRLAQEMATRYPLPRVRMNPEIP